MTLLVPSDRICFYYIGHALHGSDAQAILNYISFGEWEGNTVQKQC